MVTFCCKCVHVNVFNYEKQVFFNFSHRNLPSALISRFLAKFSGFLGIFLDPPGFDNGKVGRSASILEM